MTFVQYSEILLTMRGLTVSRGQKRLLDRVDWQVGTGEHWAVLGGNGAGKSTLLQAAAGLVWPDQTDGGEIVWHLQGRDETSPLPVREISSVISPLAQARWVNHNGGLSGEELLLCGLYKTPRIYRAVRPEDLAAAREAAAALGLSHLLNLSLEAMSQGQLRRLLIAAACLGRPRLLVLDEAADGLDAAGREALFALLADLAGGKAPFAAPDSPVTLLLAAHRAADLPGFIKRVLWLEAGRVTVQSAGAARERLPAEEVFSRKRPPAGAGVAAHPPVLELDNVSVYLGRRLVLKDLNWRVEAGQHWAVLGPNGSGKTTLLRLVWGEIPAALGGELRWFGQPGPFNIPVLRRKLGLVSDRLHQAMPGQMLAEDVVLSGFFGSIGVYEEATGSMYSAVGEILEALNLGRLAGRDFASLSFGEGRRLLLARALVHKPKLLLLDEACSGLDAASRAAFLRSLSRAAGEGTTQIIQISHHPGDLIAEIGQTLYLEPPSKPQP